MDITVAGDVPVAATAATAIIDSPAPKDERAPTSGSTVTGVGPEGLDYESGDAPNLFSGQQSSANSVVFHIPLDPSPSPDSRTIQISFRIRACGENGSSTDPSELIFRALLLARLGPVGESLPRAGAAPRSTTYTVTPSQLDLGSDLNCFAYQAIAGSAAANNALNTGLLGSSPSVPSTTASASLHFSTLFPGLPRASALREIRTSPANSTTPTSASLRRSFRPCMRTTATGAQAVFPQRPCGRERLLPNQRDERVGHGSG